MNIAGQPIKKLAQGSTRSLTMWFAVLLAALGAIQVQSETLRPLLPPEAFGWFNIFVGVAVAVLRIITTMPLADKAPQPDAPAE